MEHHRRSSTHSSLSVDVRTHTLLGGPNDPPDSTPPLASRQTSEQTRLSPTSVSGSLSRDGPPLRHGQAPGIQLGANHEIVGDHRADAMIVSPALMVDGIQSQRSEPGSGPAFQARPRPVMASTFPDQRAKSPPGVWSNPFTMPSKIIKNTQKNKRTWGECLSNTHALLSSGFVPSRR